MRTGEGMAGVMDASNSERFEFTHQAESLSCSVISLPAFGQPHAGSKLKRDSPILVQEILCALSKRIRPGWLCIYLTGSRKCQVMQPD
jgi:hypothetical protein